MRVDDNGIRELVSDPAMLDNSGFVQASARTAGRRRRHTVDFDLR